MSFHTVERFVSGLSLAIGPWGCFFGDLAKIRGKGLGHWRPAEDVVDHVCDNRKVGVVQMPEQPVLQQIVEGHSGRSPVDDGT